MLKQAVYLIIISLIAILFIKQINWFLHYIGSGYHLISNKLAIVFSGGYIATVLRHSLALILIPIVVACIPAAIYWFVKRTLMPYFYELIWVLWIMLATSMALYK